MQHPLPEFGEHEALMASMPSQPPQVGAARRAMYVVRKNPMRFLKLLSVAMILLYGIELGVFRKSSSEVTTSTAKQDDLRAVRRVRTPAPAASTAAPAPALESKLPQGSTATSSEPGQASSPSKSGSKMLSSDQANEDALQKIDAVQTPDADDDDVDDGDNDGDDATDDAKDDQDAANDNEAGGQQPAPAEPTPEPTTATPTPAPTTASPTPEPTTAAPTPAPTAVSVSSTNSTNPDDDSDEDPMKELADEDPKACVKLGKDHVEPKFAKKNACFTRKEVHSIFNTMMLKLSNTLETYDILFWLDRGSLLGSVRHKGIIPYDQDIDLGMDLASFNILRTTRIKLSSSYHLQVWNSSIHPTETRTAELPARVIHKDSGLFVDIFVFMETKDDYGDDVMGPIPSKLFNNCFHCPEIQDVGMLFQVPKKWIFPLATCPFAGARIQCPREPLKYVAYMYGPNYMTPKKYPY